MIQLGSTRTREVAWIAVSDSADEEKDDFGDVYHEEDTQDDPGLIVYRVDAEYHYHCQHHNQVLSRREQRQRSLSAAAQKII